MSDLIFTNYVGKIGHCIGCIEPVIYNNEGKRMLAFVCLSLLLAALKLMEQR